MRADVRSGAWPVARADQVLNSRAIGKTSRSDLHHNPLMILPP